jgi:ubiquinone/menaquinone biosynthesis C-methylase UbiE
MEAITDRGYLRGEQYRDGRNLNVRVQLHERFSVHAENPNRWMLRRLAVIPTARVLEVGTGLGHFWRDTRDLRPAGWHVLCSDLSPGMVAEARTVLAGEGGFSFLATDVQDLPLADASVDLVLANFMLYHVPDRPRALAEIRRVLRPGGAFAAMTVGAQHMAGIRDLVQRFAPEYPADAAAPSINFLLENGAAQLAPFFDAVQVERLPNALAITEAAPLVDYVRSMWNYADAIAGREAAFSAFVAQEIVAHGAVHSPKEIGMLIGRRAV